jgi:3-(3-hydroxy-phenyl)propionate hydroxylase
MNMSAEAFDVVIVGFGPVGAVAANLLGGSGLRVALLDAAAGIYDKPRAIVADHEMLRTLQICKLPGDLSEYVYAYPGSNFIGVEGEVIRKFQALPPPYPLAWPSSASFIQPELEGLLRRGAAQHENVDIFLRHELTGLECRDGVAQLSAVDLEQARHRRFAARYVLACDGARSFVRKALDMDLEDLDFDEEWMVVDAWLTRPTDLPQTSIQYCQPIRPRTFCLGPRNLRRWEMKLLPGEKAEEFASHEQVLAKLRPFVDVDALEIWRAAVYRFHAVMARQWRNGNVFLLGDAAHQTPPFSAQGLCSGVRDVANLVWKIRHIEELGADRELLASYQEERAPHFRTVVTRSKENGKVIGELDDALARERDRRMIEALNSGQASIYRTSSIPHLTTGLLWMPDGIAESPSGTLFIQPHVRDHELGERRLEDILQPRFLLVSGSRDPQVWMTEEHKRIWRQLGAQRVVIRHGLESAEVAQRDPESGPEKDAMRDVLELFETGDVFHSWRALHDATITIVRPDRYVYGVARSPIELELMMHALSASMFPGGMPDEQVQLEFQQRYIDVGGLRTRVLEAGSGEPVILLHSGGGYADSYVRNLKAHAKHFKVYVPDMAGYGFTDRPAWEYKLQDMVDFLGRFQAAIGAEQVRLSGLSVGAWIAALYAAQHPNRVRKLVMNCGVPLRPDEKGVQEFIDRSRRESTQRTAEDLRANALAQLTKLLGDPQDAAELGEVSYRLCWLPEKAPETRRIIDTQLGEMIHETKTSMQDGPEALRNIRCPTLIMWARANPGQSLDLAERALALCRNARLHVFERAGHWPQWEESEEYNRVQIDFFREA